MNLLKSEGFSDRRAGDGAVDNPLVAATGHRICNDCMKACIYQKQEPVDIPQIETRTLKDVLGLPWGFEIYSLLTRWNPLNLRRPIPRPATGRTVLVVGLGPGRLQSRASPDERRPHGGRHRRPEDRAAAGRRSRASRPTARACRSRAIQRHRDAARGSRRPRHGGLRRRRRVRHHRALGQELPEDGAPAARAARAVLDVRRRALRRHASRSRTPSPWASTTSRCAPAPASRPCSTCRTAWRAACARRRTS